MTILSCTHVLPLRRLLIRHRRLSSSNASSSTTTTAAFSFSSLLSWYSKQLDRRPISTKIISSALIAASGDIICQVLDNNDSNSSNNIKDDYSSDDIHAAAAHTASKNEERIVADTNKRMKDTIVAASISIVVDDEKYDSAFKTTDHTTPQQHMTFSIDWYRTGRFFLIGAFFVAPATHVWYGFLSTRLIPGRASPKRIVQRLFIDQFGAAPLFCNTFMGLLWLLEGKKSSVVRTELFEAAPKLIVSNWKLWIPAMGVMFSVVPLKFQVLYSNVVGLIWTVYLSYASTRLQKSSSPPFLEPSIII